MFDELQRANSADKFQSSVLSLFPTRDHDFVKTATKMVKWPLKVIRLNRGFTLEQNGERISLTIENLSERRYKINDRIDWIYQRNNPLQVQAEVLSRALEKNASIFDFFMNRAHAGALGEAVKILFMALVLSGIVTPSINDSVMTYWRPAYKAGYCKGTPRESSFENYKYCEEYYKWEDTIRAAKITIPDAKPVAPSKATSEQVKLSYTCAPPSNEKKQMVILAEGKEELEGKFHKIVSKHTIEFDKDNKPLKIMQEMVEPSTGRVTTFELNSTGSVDTISDNKGKFLSRLKQYSNLMTPEKFKQMSIDELVIPELVGFIVSCNKKADEVIAAASAPSSLLAAESVKSVAPAIIDHHIEADAKTEK